MARRPFASYGFLAAGQLAAAERAVLLTLGQPRLAQRVVSVRAE